ncbi:hypothetical protein PO124_02435 [Bacillus licheniformis]|nr:hypothetical protein [Bacillus licheniformis]
MMTSSSLRQSLCKWKQLKADQTIRSKALSEPSYYIVTDKDFAQLKNRKRNRFYAWQAKEADGMALVKAGEALQKKLDYMYFGAVDYEVYNISKGYGPILFVGLFIGIVFFVSAGSFLYSGCTLIWTMISRNSNRLPNGLNRPRTA